MAVPAVIMDEGVEILSPASKKLVARNGVSFWEYLTDRVGGKKLIPTLGKLIAQKAKVSLGDLAETVSLSLA